MIILGINSATPLTEIALVSAGETLFEDAWQSNYNEAEKLLPALEKALAAAAAKMQNGLNKPKKGHKVLPGRFEKSRPGTTRRVVGQNFSSPALSVGGGSLDAIFVVQGPGSYTGLRIGVTIANTLATIYNIPLLTLSTSQYTSPLAELLKTKKIHTLPHHKLVKPLYLRPPTITKSKKPTFT